MEKINISKIFIDHFNTLKEYDKNKYSIGDIFLFYLMPITLSFILSFFIKFNALSNIDSELITFYSVFGGFMLNILALIYGYNIDKFKNPVTAKIVLKEISSNIAYLISIASLSIIILFSLKIIKNISFFELVFKQPSLLKNICNQALVTIVLFLLVNFCLTILMILKRFYSLDNNRDVK